MNPQRWPGGGILLLGFLIAIVPQYIFPVCDGTLETISGKHIPMKCHWTAIAELGTGGLISLGGISLMIFKDSGIRLGISLMTLFSAILALLFPVWLIGVCPSPLMPCHAGTLPALVILSSFTAALSLGNLFFLSKRHKE
ncbi:DUF4418 family protein [Budvicia aquatica]|uniref:DUF4418 domain-containing protein n=1 Tax=Budvicia aquatica TaxID=82979 RepID=A0A2C6DHG9_9GAMM|nr:DUF4418 family protein [Budvicia aquatica]PHI28203.1 DUF4418 domain-containing protein [Budvicia aquatica]VFS46056.1 Uncharacterised protein [Budvicia aquatica]